MLFSFDNCLFVSVVQSFFLIFSSPIIPPFITIVILFVIFVIIFTVTTTITLILFVLWVVCVFGVLATLASSSSYFTTTPDDWTGLESLLLLC